MIRTTARKLSKNAWFWRKLPARYGARKVRVSPSSHLAYWMKSLDHVHGELFDAVDRLVKPGSVVWDVGANVGVVSVASSSVAGPGGFVLGVEADMTLVPRLRATAARAAGNAAPIEILPAAASESVGIARFNISSASSATNALAGFGRVPGIARVDTVVTVTLDWLLDHYRAPDVLKIDVEGAELLVLRGGKKLFATKRPIIVVESGEEIADEMKALLNDYNYVPYKMYVPAGKREPLTEVKGDVIALPREAPLPW